MINLKRFTKVGVIGVGGYVPKYRLKVEERVGIKHKSVSGKDEDTVSLAVEAGRMALERAGIKAEELGAVLVGSESHPYAVKPTGTIVGDILGVGNEYYCADLEFACKAGTTGIVMIAGMIEAGMIECGMAIGADVAQAKPGDALEHTIGAGAGAMILGSRKYKWRAELLRTGSFNSDTADFWRREGERYPEHGGRFTGEPGYFKHVIEGTEMFLKRGKDKIGDFEQVVLHMPNVKFPLRASKRLGIREKQLKKGFIVKEIGNPYSGSSMLGLVKVMEESRLGEKILVTSYGSGAGSDCLSFRIKNEKKWKRKGIDIKGQLKNIEYVSYAEYLQMRGII